jgi:hypothetical protein
MMRLRDCVSLLGFVSLGISIVSAGAPSMASTRPANAIPARTVDSAGMSGGMKAPAALRLNLDGRDVVTIYATGDVRVADDLTIDEASREFWEKVGELAPHFCRTRAALD